MPEWVLEMQQAGLIIEVEKFSKFCTGAAVMNLHTIKRVPSWIAAVKTMLEIELASKSKDWFGMEMRGKEQVNEEETIVPKKKVVVPEKIEPREYLSNERTLLKWVRMCFLALFVGLALLSFQHEPITGILLTSFSLGVLLRAYYVECASLFFIFIFNYLHFFFFPLVWRDTDVLSSVENVSS
ncbi:hypothetical protein RFI_16294 [Reticulomyxa filosa]|uniref:DUF202 domain-containing protein n=1 Tax=Reticulomyxa filosa TaxID=46433 RepID=X6N5A9_RETFI|nr:hypothetical protein RFI_16294 [Reticulomyxa filosa]|eukprot:ETO20914.1 hypothetical protein RFI_16294 [Reticulomyxa filosa]